ncbi:MAG: CHAT domain-containing protein [Xenococcaceae cyanobacterium MO_188.B32]|nr:CHAT domain-containing protein [Xenococcaceae cyanobacterium MO_188.B32]
MNDSEVNSTLKKLSRSLRKPFTAPEGKVLGKQVYDWLIKPLENNLTNSQISTLVFVLDGELGNIPMSALYDGQKYLVEKYSIGLAPGLQLLDPKPLQQVKLEALVGGLSEPRHGFTGLENVKREIEEIDAQLPSEVLIDSNFTSTALQNQIANIPYPVVHLASHGKFSSNADETFILAWDKPIKVKELNNFLRQSQQTEDKALELLVLSACETATGDKKAALGLAGVAIQAGARSTLATLWTVSDEATAEFMSQFYRLLSQGNLSKSEALRQAQLILLNDPNYDTPYLWAAFVLLGNWL